MWNKISKHTDQRTWAKLENAWRGWLALMSCVYKTMFDVPHESAADKTQSGGSTIFWVPQSLTDLAPDGVTIIYPQNFIWNSYQSWRSYIFSSKSLQIRRGFSCLYNAEGMNQILWVHTWSSVHAVWVGLLSAVASVGGCAGHEHKGPVRQQWLHMVKVVDVV